MASFDQIAKEYSLTDDAKEKRYVSGPSLPIFCGDLANKTVLDVPCGTGYFTRKIKDAGAKKVIGIDISSEEIKIAKSIEEQKKQGIQYIVGDMRKFNGKELKGEKFDIVTVTFLFDHTNNPQELQEMANNCFKLLKNGGKLVALIDNPHIENFSNQKYDVTIDAIEPIKDGSTKKITYWKGGKILVSFPFYHWSKKTYDSVLTKAGFTEIKWEKPIVSEEGIENYGKAFWEDQYNNPLFFVVTCEKISDGKNEKENNLSEIRKLQYKMIESFNNVPESGKEIEWMGKKFIVYKSVFWPSNDSKTMAENFKINKGETVLDVCTGSGNIAILSAYLGAKSVIGIDISPNAIKSAKENAIKHGFTEITEFRLGNALDPLSANEKFDVITINPPFTKKEVENFGEKTIFNSGLKLYKDFFSKVNEHLNPKGRIYITNASFGACVEMKKMAKEAGFYVKKIGETKMTDIPREYYAFELTKNKITDFRK